MAVLTRERWRQVGEIFDRALELPSAERDVFLSHACAGDDRLRSEVEHLLSAYAESGDFLALPAAEFLTSGVAEEQPPPSGPGLAIGVQIGPCRVLRELTRGGMGEVYLAERADGQFKQEVALKLLVRSGRDSSEVHRRFLCERQTLTRLRHPNIAALLDVGLTADGRPWFAMELVEGAPLKVWCDERELGLSERLALFEDVCLAVQHAHQNLVLHRDLKPSSILVTNEGQVKLLDFGIAELLPDTSRTGLRALTLEYAAPEQLQGQPVTAATDVYALGAVLYELLAGHRPYRLPRRSVAEIEWIICETDPLPPRLGDELDAILLRALQKEPGYRYASVEALLDDLRRFRAGLPVFARPHTAAYRTKHFIRRHRLGVSAGVVLLLALLAGLAATWWQARLAAREASRAREVKSVLAELFRASNPAESGGRQLTAQELLARGVARLDSASGRKPEVQEQLLAVLGLVHHRLGFYAQADTLLTRATALARGVYGPKHAEFAARLNDRGITLKALGNLPAAESLFTEALMVRRLTLGPDHPAVAATMGELASLLLDAGQPAQAESWYRQALEIDRRHYGSDHLQVAQDLSDLAALLGDDLQRYNEAGLAYRAALGIRLRHFDSGHPVVLENMGHLGATLAGAGRYAEAESLERKVLEGYERLHPNGHPDIAWSRHLLADLTQDMGRYPEAEALQVQALEMRRRMLGPDHQLTMATLNDLAVLRYRMDDLAGAEQSYREAVAIWRDKLGASHPFTIRGQTNLGAVLSEAGKYEEAEGLLWEAQEAERRERGDSSVDGAMVGRKLGILLHRTGRLDEAEQYLRRSLAVYRQQLPDSHPDIAEALTALGSVLTDRGRAREAYPVLREALAIQEEAFSAEDPRLAETRQALGEAMAAEGSRVAAEALVRLACRDYERSPWMVRKARDCHQALARITRKFTASN
jgi:eukaryotic-like serine/threonine-protein kinase